MRIQRGMVRAGGSGVVCRDGICRYSISRGRVIDFYMGDSERRRGEIRSDYGRAVFWNCDFMVFRVVFAYGSSGTAPRMAVTAVRTLVFL